MGKQPQDKNNLLKIGKSMEEMNNPSFPGMFQRSLVIREIIMLFTYKESVQDQTDFCCSAYPVAGFELPMIS